MSKNSVVITPIIVQSFQLIAIAENPGTKNQFQTRNTISPIKLANRILLIKKLNIDFISS